LLSAIDLGENDFATLFYVFADCGFFSLFLLGITLGCALAWWICRRRSPDEQDFDERGFPRRR